MKKIALAGATLALVLQQEAHLQRTA